ncbi:oxidative stress-responsive serine-rich protein 1 [Cheilinus undulatus]|uniref:oxidative stress-responsive serine-rich protein 1 n=1 Tax=Cheilinus undulatus TaxID=241271 RepID=UPI001BD673BC|nr:oxidative stress-responsive serine-rich protein 1 [Cheilinus undulatus]XP_041639503.1 oxidative stress-responsive serine-rich protein 1 [Cheilinus undulatus]
MEAGGKDCEEETLQTAFKKLRVDAESLPGAVSVSEALTPRAASRACLESGGAKPKLSCPKDNWHGCMRKSSRGASRTQRRRRSKSPILQPPKFTYCSNTASSTLSPPGGCLKHQRLAVPDPTESRSAADGAAASSVSVPARNELSPSGHIAPFGSCAGFETQEVTATVVTSSSQDRGSSVELSEENGVEKSACDGAESATIPRPTEAADFRALSELHSNSDNGAIVSCSCSRKKSSSSQDGGAQVAQSQCHCQSNQQGWAGVEVYSFTGLRNVISECERGMPSHADATRTLSTNTNAATASPSGSPRSCSEQARAYVDDITIEDLSGYMEYYLYIPKKMSHMAEMMYT